MTELQVTVDVIYKCKLKFTDIFLVKSSFCCSSIQAPIVTNSFLKISATEGKSVISSFRTTVFQVAVLVDSALNVSLYNTCGVVVLCTHGPRVLLFMPPRSYTVACVLQIIINMP